MSSREHDWRDDAKCRGIVTKIECKHEDGTVTEEDLFYPPRSKTWYMPIADAAKAMCNGRDARPACPVRDQCRWAAMSVGEEHGIWGGMSHRERNAAERKWMKKYPNGEKSLEDYVMGGLK